MRPPKPEPSPEATARCKCGAWLLTPQALKRKRCQGCYVAFKTAAKNQRLAKAKKERQRRLDAYRVFEGPHRLLGPQAKIEVVD